MFSTVLGFGVVSSLFFISGFILYLVRLIVSFPIHPFLYLNSSSSTSLLTTLLLWPKSPISFYSYFTYLLFDYFVIISSLNMYLNHHFDLFSILFFQLCSLLLNFLACIRVPNSIRSSHTPSHRVRLSVIISSPIICISFFLFNVKPFNPYAILSLTIVL